MKSKMKLLAVCCAIIAIMPCLCTTAYSAPMGDVAGACVFLCQARYGTFYLQKHGQFEQSTPAILLHAWCLP